MTVECRGEHWGKIPKGGVYVQLLKGEVFYSVVNLKAGKKATCSSNVFREKIPDRTQRILNLIRYNFVSGRGRDDGGDEVQFTAAIHSYKKLQRMGIGKILMLVGGILLVAGLIFHYAEKLPWLGRLPGDIVIERENFRLYIPLATSLLLSILLTIIIYLINRFRH